MITIENLIEERIRVYVAKGGFLCCVTGYLYKYDADHYEIDDGSGDHFLKFPKNSSMEFTEDDSCRPSIPVINIEFE